MGVQLVVASGSRAGQVIPITGERFVIGRADDCNLKPRSELISRYHCEISIKEGEAFVRDMGSKNGVFLNDEQITETIKLKNGDKVVVGPLDFFAHITIEGKPQKQSAVKSVSDAVARTVELQESSGKSHEDSIAEWLLATGESNDEVTTQTVDASELLAHLQNQSEEAANRAREEQEAAEHQEGASGLRMGTPASSRDAASELLRKFFKGGK